jgi:hypothetical protein
MWWNIQLKMKHKGEEIWTTLALRAHDLSICGFRNHNKDIWYCQWSHHPHGKMFEQEYDAFPITICMNSDPKYFSGTTYYGKNPAMFAVALLSRYQLPDHHVGSSDSCFGVMNSIDEDHTGELRSLLETLHLMVSYSASIITVHNAVGQQGSWDKWVTADPKLLDLMSFWSSSISISTLEQWQRCGGDSPPWNHDHNLLKRFGINSPQHAREVFALIKEGDE